jgi:hypothetical protein
MDEKTLADGGTEWAERGYLDVDATTGPLPGSVPTPPASISFGTLVAGSAPVTWGASTSPNPKLYPLTVYQVSRDGVVIATVGPTTLTYTDTTVVAGGTYDYAVQGVNGVGPGLPVDAVAQISDGTIPTGSPGQVPSATHDTQTGTGWTEHWISPPAPFKTGYGGLYATSDPKGLGHIWLKVSWASLNSADGTFDFSSITNLAAANPTINYRVHVNHGHLAPAWLLKKIGTVNVKNSKDVVTYPCPKYWLPSFQDAYATFVTAMGQVLDPIPNVVSINCGVASLVYDEGFILGSDPTSVAAMYDSGNGLTAQNGKDAMLAGMAALTAAFPTTICEFAGHDQRQYPSSGNDGHQAGTQVNDWATTTDVGGRAILNQLHNLYGQHMIVTDYGLGPGEAQAAAASLTSAASEYGWIHKRAALGYPVAFQLTAAVGGKPPTAQNLMDAIDAGISMQGRWVEHASYTASDRAMTTLEQTSRDTSLKANVPGVSSGPAPTGYRVYVDNAKYGPDLPATARSVVITGQSPGNHYVTIRAFNAAGAGPSSGYDLISL